MFPFLRIPSYYRTQSTRERSMIVKVRACRVEQNSKYIGAGSAVSAATTLEGRYSDRLPGAPGLRVDVIQTHFTLLRQCV